MIIWLASYPKSGNTWVRAFLTNYLYYKEGTILENLSSIDLFPSEKYFKGLINKQEIVENKKEIYKYYLLAQDKLNLNNKINIIKTHCFAGKVEGIDFTNSENTAGFIYIVRDPRSIAVSNAYHEEVDFDYSVDQILNPNRFSIIQDIYLEFRSSLKNHYLSWSKKNWHNLFIKYEDLHLDPFSNFKKILFFISGIGFFPTSPILPAKIEIKTWVFLLITFNIFAVCLAVYTAVIFILIFFLFNFLITFPINTPFELVTGTFTNMFFPHLLIISPCLNISFSLSAKTSNEMGFFVILSIF